MTDNQLRAASRGLVVAGVDGSPNSLAALRHAVHAARRRGACVELVYVVSPGASPGAQITGFSKLEMAVRCEFPRGCDVPLRYTVECGDPAGILVKRSANAELLVIGGRLPLGARPSPRRERGALLPRPRRLPSGHLRRPAGPDPASAPHACPPPRPQPASRDARPGRRPAAGRARPPPDRPGRRRAPARRPAALHREVAERRPHRDGVPRPVRPHHPGRPSGRHRAQPGETA